MKSTTALKVLLLAVIITSMFVVSACAPNRDISDGFLTSQPNLDESEDVSDEASNDETSTAPGHASAPVITDVLYVTPQDVIVIGKCDEGCEVTVTDGETSASTKSVEGYFVLNYTIDTTNFVVLSATAKSETLKESEITPFRVQYNSTAMKRIDGYGVTVGKDSNFYYDNDLAYYTGVIHELSGVDTSTLLTQTKLAAFEASVNTKVKNFKKRADGAPVEIIYVTIPNAITVYPERLAEGTVQNNYSTRYEQVVKSLGNTDATVIDMTAAFEEAKAKGEKIFYNTDSHLTEYGGYLVYKAICDHMAERFPEAKARDLETEFTSEEKLLKGGNTASHMGANTNVIKEKATMYTPKFSLNIGKEDSAVGTATTRISDFAKYASEDSMIVASTSKDASYRLIFATNRPNLPCALIYRDDYAMNFSDILAERFNRVLVAQVDDFTINMTDAQRYYGVDEKGKAKTTVDYIIVIVSESNLGLISGLGN